MTSSIHQTHPLHPPSLDASVPGAPAPGRGSIQGPTKQPSRLFQSGSDFLAGCVASMTAATITAPLDVLRTRFQSDFYVHALAEERFKRGIANTSSLSFRDAVALHFRETFQIAAAIPRREGYIAFATGLPATLAGVVPARGTHFFVVGTTRRLLADEFNNGVEERWMVPVAAAAAVAVTAAITNPIWVIKTRLQLDQRVSEESKATRQFTGALSCFRYTLKAEGVRGLYKGLSASLVGISESATQWMLYEEGKKLMRSRKTVVSEGLRRRNWGDSVLENIGESLAGGASKFVASLATYPHEVVRTRLREAPRPDGTIRYTGFIQCFNLVLRQEGVAALYGGLIPHMFRVVPNSAIMFGAYEIIRRFILNQDKKDVTEGH